MEKALLAMESAKNDHNDLRNDWWKRLVSNKEKTVATLDARAWRMDSIRARKEVLFARGIIYDDLYDGDSSIDDDYV